MISGAIIGNEPELRSNPVDRFLIFLLVVSIYFEANLPYWGKASTPFIIFGITLAYLSVFRLKTLLRLLAGRYFMSALGFAVVAIFMETLHPFASYDLIFRYLNMTIGIFGIAVLCRDRKALDVALFTFILASAAQSLVLFFGTASFLRTFNVEGFYESSRARIQAYEEFVLRGNLNEISYFSSIGAIIGIIWFYYEKRKWFRIILLSLTIPSVLGVFMPASRTGAILFFVSLIIFIYKAKIHIRRWIYPVLILGGFVLVAIPEVIWVRIFSFLHLTELQETDSRTKIFSAILTNFPRYFLDGVGAGNYWQGWAVHAGISNRFTSDIAIAAHNAYLQVWIYWGLPGILSFLTLIYTFSKALDRRIPGDYRKAALYIFVMMIPLIFIFYHSFYHKSFSIGLGMLIGTRFWNVFDVEETEERKLT